MNISHIFKQFSLGGICSHWHPLRWRGYSQRPQIVYTDGSCRMLDKKNRFGGYGVYWGHNDSRNTSQILPSTPSNSRGELTAVIEAIKMHNSGNPLVVVTDSDYVLKVVTAIRRNLHKLFQNGDLVEQLAHVLTDKVSFQHVLKSSNCPGNVAADRLAREASRRAMSMAAFRKKVNANAN